MFMRMGARVLERISPLGLIIGGASLALSIPPLRKGLRKVAVMAVGGVMMVADQVQSLMARGREEAKDIIAEASMSDLEDDMISVEEMKNRSL